MVENLDVTMLFDIYGGLLTEKQQNFITYYYDDDLSLAEIAENEGITRQGVRDAIKRAEAQLVTFEAHLHLRDRYQKEEAAFEEIRSLADVIREINKNTILSREINAAASRIGSLAEELSEMKGSDTDGI